MKTHFLIPSFVILSLLFPLAVGCKKGPIPEILPAADTHVLVKPLEDKKTTGYQRLKIKPFCYNDFNMAYLNSKKEGC
ncbi:MAG: hypothetical protein Q8M29_05145 [Bacteroidota bacterium]|nr:hypothetical protein [Bacteroidota bacterium]